MIISEVVEEETDGVKVYGLKFVDKQSGEEVCTEHDIFTDEKSARTLCETVNQSEVSREHIKDIIEDAVGVL